MQLGELTVDVEKKIVLRGLQRVRLSRTEWALLAALLHEPGAVVQHSTLLRRVWGDAYHDAHEYLHVYIGRLRRKLEQDHTTPQIIITEPGTGYRLGVLPAQKLPSPPAPEPIKPVASLPHIASPLIGRDHEVALLGALLRQRDARAITLTGMGGVGKTRLATEVARLSRPHFADGVAFVALSAIEEPSMVGSAILRALGFQEAGDQSVRAQMERALHDKQMLLVLDNFEHLLAATPLVTDLIVALPRLTIMITSRTPLHISSEHELRIEPLPAPDPQQLPSLAALAEVPSVALFTLRAQAVRPDFALTSANASATAHLCARLHGLPLAIELAAARARLLTPQAIVERLGPVSAPSMLWMLTDGMRDRPERQHTLRNTIAWSYRLLDPVAQQIFVRLGVFAGGGDLDAIEQVCAELQEPARASRLVDTLGVLCDHNLLLVEHTDRQPRFMLVEALREFALEQLEASGEVSTLRERHAHYYLALVEQAALELTGRAQALWLNRIERDLDNIRSAIAWTCSRQQDAAQRMGAALWRFWYTRGYLDEGRMWLQRILQGSEAISATAASASNGAGVLALAQCDYPQASAHFTRCLALRRQLGDKQGMAHTLNNLGIIAYMQCDYPRARELYQESLALARASHDTRSVAYALSNLGIVAMYQCDFPQATDYYEESLAIYRTLDEQARMVPVMCNLGSLALYQKQYDRAHVLLHEALASFRDAGDQTGSATALINLAHLAIDQGRLSNAHAYLAEACAIHQEQGHKAGLGWVFVGLAEVACKQDDAARAARLCGAAETLRIQINAPLPQPDQIRYQRTLREARESLGDALFAALLTQGSVLILEQALADALQSASTLNMAGAPFTSTDVPFEGLTQRETDIVRLLVQGLADRDIGEQLAISPRTVDTHLRRIFRKAQVSSRTQLVAWLLTTGPLRRIVG